MGQPLQLAGQKFGHLRAIEPIARRDKSGNVYWRCKCEKCGNETEAIARDLKRGNRTSCGCAIGEKARIKMKARAEALGGTLPGQQNMKVPVTSTTGVKGVTKYYSHGKFRGYRAYLTFKGKQYQGGVFSTLEEASEARKKLEERYYHVPEKDVAAEKRYQDILTIQAFYKKHGRPPLAKDFGGKYRAIVNHFGSWNNALMEAGLKPTKLKRKEKWTLERITEEARNAAIDGQLNSADFSLRNVVKDVFDGTWREFLTYCGLQHRPRKEPNYLKKPFAQYTDDELIKHLKRRAVELGRTPVIGDIVVSKLYVTRFGSWTNTLKQAELDLVADHHYLTKSEIIAKAQQESDQGYVSTSRFSHYYQAVKNFGSWEAFKKEAGLLEKKKESK